MKETIRKEFSNYQNWLAASLSLSITLQEHSLTFFLHNFNTSKFRNYSCEKFHQKKISTAKYAASKNMKMLSKKLLQTSLINYWNKNNY